MSQYDKLYETITQALVDDGYAIINNAFENSLPSFLLTTAQDKSLYKQAAISQTTLVNTNKRSDKTKWIDADDFAQSQYLQIMQGLQNYLNHSLYLGLSYYESHFALYEDGDFYERHLDSFKASKNRIVTTVYYLNKDWHKNDGGELIIYNKCNKQVQTVSPSSNTLVVFLSEEFPHEVLVSSKNRYSIAGWFRVDK